MNCQIVQNGAQTALPGETTQELCAAAEAFARSIGVRHYSYMLLNPPRGFCGAHTLRASYPAEWVARYTAKVYAHRDPVLARARAARLAFRWGHGAFLRAFDKRRQRVFHEARTFGVTEGYAVPLHGPDGEIAVFSVCAPEAAAVEDAVNAAAADLQLFAVRFHDEMLRRCAIRPAPQALTLTPRQAEALKWTADGLTTKETADRLCLTPSAVNYHLGKAARALGASSKHHAAIIALQRGLI